MSRPRFEASSLGKITRRQSPYWAEHVARYSFAASHVVNRCILDIACGDGYGLPILQAPARQIVGVDLDLLAAKNAQAEIGRDHGRVVVADGCSLPFGDASFDGITSFETLEHLEQRDMFVAELRRVLTPEGICIVSTPNANSTLPVDGKPKNPYHVHEYTPEELHEELGRHFTRVTMLGQSLNHRFVIPPFWEEQELLAKKPGMRKQILFWRALHKLPFTSVRDQVSRTLWGHPFLPSETDYQFSQSVVNTAPVLVALCNNTQVG